LKDFPFTRFFGRSATCHSPQLPIKLGRIGPLNPPRPALTHAKPRACLALIAFRCSCGRIRLSSSDFPGIAMAFYLESRAPFTLPFPIFQVKNALRGVQYNLNENLNRDRASLIIKCICAELLAGKCPEKGPLLFTFPPRVSSVERLRAAFAK